MFWNLINPYPGWWIVYVMVLLCPVFPAQYRLKKKVSIVYLGAL